MLTVPDNGPRIRAEIESARRASACPASGVSGAPGAPEAARGPGSPAAASAPAPGHPAVSPGLAGVADCPDLAAAVARAFGWARPDGVVLLSPAAPSFGQFRDYRERGEAFIRAMQGCRAASSAP